MSITRRIYIFFRPRRCTRFFRPQPGEETFAIEGKVEETTSLKAIEVGGKTYIFFGFNKQLIAFDGETGQQVWQTAEGSVEGSVRWVGSAPGSDNVLIVTLRADKFGGDTGTWLKMYSLNAATGDVAWSQMIGYSQLASVFVNKAFSGAASGRGGYEISIWFEGPYEDGDNLIFLIKGSITGDPVTLERKESQGLISINGNTGKVNYQAKFPVFGKPGKGYAILGVGALNDLNDGYPAPIEIGNTIIAAGDELVVAVDKSSGKIKWQTETPGLVTDLDERDGALVAQIGKMVVTTAMDDKGKMKTKSTGAKPFGFAVIDVGSGSIKWSNTEFKVDPTLAMAGHVSDDDDEMVSPPSDLAG